jgi:hypothetical protein
MSTGDNETPDYEGKLKREVKREVKREPRLKHDLKAA